MPEENLPPAIPVRAPPGLRLVPPAENQATRLELERLAAERWILVHTHTHGREKGSPLMVYLILDRHPDALPSEEQVKATARGMAKWQAWTVRNAVREVADGYECQVVVLTKAGA